MKKIIFLLIFNVIVMALKSQDNCCTPDENGMYTYYLNLKTDLNAKNLRKSFSKENLFSLLKSSKNVSTKKMSNYETEIKEAIISFPTAETKLLQQSITIKSPNPHLDIELNTYSDIFNFVEKECSFNELLAYEPNDYRLAASWFEHLDLIKAPDAWGITKGDSRILIGIIDNYINPEHIELKDQIVQILQNGSVNWHGTAVAGCAAAHTDNGTRIASIGFNSKIVFSSKLFSNDEVLRMAQIPGVRVINCSWYNSCSYSATINALYKEIRDIHNVVVTAGAGNTTSHCGSLNAYIYPASYESVISVTSVAHSTERGTILPTYGKYMWKDCHEQVIGDPNSTHHHNDKVNICAPGYGIYSLGSDSNNSLMACWGTSFAAPIVAGVCALVASVNPCLTAKEIQEIVLSTADASIYDIPENAPYIGLLGTGRVDAYEAVKKAVELGGIYIQNATLNGTVNKIAATELKATNTIVNTGSGITFKATRDIELQSGFEVKNGAVFNAEIYESECF